MDEHSNLASTTNSSNTNEFDLGLFIFILRKNLIWIIFIVVLSIFGVFITLRFSVPIYKVSATLQIEKNDRANQLLQVNELYETSDISGETEPLNSKYLILRTIKSLPLQVGYYSKGQFLEKDLYTSSPFKVDLKVIDSSIIGMSFYIDFINSQTAVLDFIGADGLEQTKVISGDSWVKLKQFELKITLEDYTTFLNNNDQVKKNKA
ncbi:Wzz/FepE/Etk N-terminal domain-containing protein [Vicingaceae bacterium]|nr:Wzz/FepE/Etk N-terminal domain-containing protein [Vicingaceae bacterium]